MMVGTIIHARDEGCACDKGCATKAVKGHMDDSERLAAYDAFARGIRAELAEVGARMDVLRTSKRNSWSTPSGICTCSDLAV